MGIGDVTPNLMNLLNLQNKQTNVVISVNSYRQKNVIVSFTHVQFKI